MIEKEYDPVLLGFIVDVAPCNLQVVKDQLVQIVSSMESDEKAYIYHPNRNTIPRWIGEAVGCIANYSPLKIDLRKAFKKIVALMSQEDSDARRFFFVITDGCFVDRPESTRTKLSKILEQKNVPIWDRQDIFTIVFQTEGPSGVFGSYGLSTINLNNLAAIIKFMKEKNGRTQTSEESETDAG